MIFYLKGEMMKNKILIGLVLFGGFVNGGDIKGTYSNCDEDMVHYSSNIDRKTMCGMGTSLALPAKTLTITQTNNPCFFIQKYLIKQWKVKKVNGNTITMQGVNKFSKGMRPDLGHNIAFENDGTIKYAYSIVVGDKIVQKKGREVVQLLGTSKTCYLNPTTEVWDIKYMDMKTSKEKEEKVTFQLH